MRRTSGCRWGPSRGRGLGRGRGQDVADALSASKAARTGLLRDLEDSVLLVPGIGHDIVSDITTNVLRGPLIGYTQRVAHHYGISLIPGVDSGPVWHPHRREWERGFVELPVAAGRKLLLVPKALVRYRMDYDKDEYYRNFLVPILQDEELAKPGSALVDVLRDRRRRVTKKAIRAKYGDSKLAIVDLTLEHIEALDRYRECKAEYVTPPLDHAGLAERAGGDVPDFDELLAAVRAVPAGTAHATAYHRAVEALLTALFYPALVEPVIEDEIHQGRKRIDIRYTNTARHGFFAWLARHGVASKLIFVECKNYGRDVGNPELDQLAGPFSAALWRSAHGQSLIEAAVTNGVSFWEWHEHRWGVVLELAFEDEERRDGFRDLPAVQAALDAVPDPVNGLLIYHGRGGGAGVAVPRRPRPTPMAGAEALPESPEEPIVQLFSDPDLVG